MLLKLYDGKNLMLSRAPEPEDFLGTLPDVLSCVISRDTEGIFDLTLEYREFGENFHLLNTNNWIYCCAGGKMGYQYFRIDQVSMDISGTWTVHAVHLYYNADAILAGSFASVDPDNPADTTYLSWYGALLEGINSVDSSQLGSFVVIGHTDAMLLNAASYEEPVSLKQAITDAIKDRNIYLKYQTFGVGLWQLPSFDTAPSFRVRYKRDMLTYGESIDASEFYTHIYPYYVAGDRVITHAQKIFPLQNLPDSMQGYRRIQAVNLSEYYSGLNYELDQGTLLYVINRWLGDHPWNPLPQEIETGVLDLLDASPEQNIFELGNIGKIYTPLNEVYTVSIVSLEYNVLTGRITKLGINRRKLDITDTIAGLIK